MATSIHIEATVSADGTLEIRAPELTPGQRARVTIEPQEAAEERTLRAIDVINAAQGHLEFQTADEVDAYIKEERDSWEP